MGELMHGARGGIGGRLQRQESQRLARDLGGVDLEMDFGGEGEAGTPGDPHI